MLQRTNVSLPSKLNNKGAGMKVVNLKEYRSVEVVSILEKLKRKAAVRGAFSLIYAVDFGNGEYESGIIGDYHKTPVKGLLAANRLVHQLHKLEDEMVA
jgi:hypothetical protein